MEHVRPIEPATKAKRGRPRKTLCLDDGRTPIDPPTFVHIKAHSPMIDMASFASPCSVWSPD